MGQRAKAEPTLRQAMSAIEKTLGTDNRPYVSALMTLANLSHNAGDFDKEEEINRRAMAILERIEDTESSMYAGLLNNLGEVFRERQDYTRAEDFYQRALTLGARVLGDDAYRSPSHCRILASSRASERTMRRPRRTTRARSPSANGSSVSTIRMSLSS